MNKLVAGTLILLVLSIGGFFLFTNLQKSKNSKTGQAMQKTENGINQEYQGKVLAGSSSPFLEFNRVDYEKAKIDGKVVFLDFYATWCPICRAEAPEIDAGFNSLTTNQVVGFRVNFNDPDTDDDEKSLAQEFGIPYQHTKVIIKNGSEISRSSDTWKKDDFLNVINDAVK